LSSGFLGTRMSHVPGPPLRGQPSWYVQRRLGWCPVLVPHHAPLKVPVIRVCLCACVPVCQWIRKWNKFPLKQPRVTGVVLRAVHECLRVVEHRSGRKLAAASDAAVVRTTLHPAQVRPACCATKPASLPSFRQVWPRVCGVRAVRAVRVCVSAAVCVDVVSRRRSAPGAQAERHGSAADTGGACAGPGVGNAMHCAPPPPVCAHPVLPHCMPSLPSEPPDSPLPLSPGLPLRCLRP
jgi:hypothetical protein